MAISFHFVLSFRSASLLVSLVQAFEKYPKGLNTKTNKWNTPVWEPFHEAIRTTADNHFVTHLKPLKRLGLVTAEHDDQGHVHWNVTPKGKAMAKVIELELGEVNSALKLQHRKVKRLVAGRD